jgi:hypothetical protein
METNLPAKKSAHVGQEIVVKIEFSDTHSFLLLGAATENPQRTTQPYIPKYRTPQPAL